MPNWQLRLSSKLFQCSTKHQAQAVSAYPKRGEVYFVELRVPRGSEQGGTRPAVIISHNTSNRSSSLVTIAPITHKKTNRKYPQDVYLPSGVLDGHGGTIYCGQVQTISKLRIRNYLGTLDSLLMTDVSNALREHLGL